MTLAPPERDPFFFLLFLTPSLPHAAMTNGSAMLGR